MTIQTTALQTCDRCMRPFSQKSLKGGDAVPVFDQRGLVVTETVGTNQDEEPAYNVLISFDDLCPECFKSVENLLQRIRLEAPVKKQRGGGKKRKPKEEKEVAPETPVPEYVEKEASEEAGPAEPEPDSEIASSPEMEAEEAAEPSAAEPEETSTETVAEEDEGLVMDPVTGDKYDPATGEVVVRGQAVGKGAHPF